MGVGAALAIVSAFLSAIATLALLHGAIALARRCPRLRDIAIAEHHGLPSLSVVIAACNEAAAIGPAVRSLLAQDYPALDIVLVDDRSSDATGTLVDGLAASDPRVTALHVRSLPVGWLGKVHALQRGLERARGDFVLFTDADVHFAPGVLRRAVGWAEDARLDHVSVWARVRPASLWVGACMASSVRGVFALGRPWEANDPRSPRAIGTGAFNLVRRAAFDRTPGFDWLRLEVADDIGLGLMMKRSGGRTGFALGGDQVTHSAYPTLADAVRGLEKNAFAQGARFSPWRALALVLLALAAALGPFAAFLPLGVPWLWMVGATALVAFAVACVVIARTTGRPLVPLLVSLPVGDLLMVYVIARATILGVRRGGLVWRGTVYPTELLRAGQRVEL